MCGIVGIRVFGKQQYVVTDRHLTRMRDTMQLRGPDGAGNWIAPDGKAGLGHRRLSIIDLSDAASQPMCNEDGSLWVVFNGEIYNHAEIRAELSSLGGHTWRTDHSDTEVILHAFEQWGIECVHRFRGMFSIGLWDVRKQELWLLRDRIGIKPLYYSVHHGRLTFASEIKALLADPDQPRRVNEDALFHFLSFLTAPAPETLFEGIKKLPAASWLHVMADGRMQEKKYWDVWDHTRSLEGLTEQEITQQLLGTLRDSVRLRKISDVPMGVFLSGGLDSTSNVALFSEGETLPVKTFTIGYQGDNRSYRNEFEFARIVARRIGAEHHELTLSQDDLINFLPQMIHLQDEPIADPVCVPLYFLSKLARDNGVVVCQVGEGADELFYGYPGWKKILRAEHFSQWRLPVWAKRIVPELMRWAGKGDSFTREWYRRAAVGGPVFWGGAEAFTRDQKARLLSKRMRRQYAGRTSWEVLEPIHKRFLEKAWDPSPLNWMSYLDINMRLPELLLMRVDKMSMGVSLEGRVPFLDHKFVELAHSIPSALKFKHGEPKHILREAVRGLIPYELIDRPKQGFGVPVYEWFLDRLGRQARAEIKSFCEQTDYIDFDAVDGLFHARRGPQIWFLLNLALWWKHYVQGADISSVGGEEIVLSSTALPKVAIPAPVVETKRGSALKTVVKQMPYRLVSHVHRLPAAVKYGRDYQVWRKAITRMLHGDRAAVEGYILQKLRQQVARACRNIPFYQRLYAGLGFSPEHMTFADFKRLPIVTKDDLRNCPFAERMDARQRHVLVNTGGTSGAPLAFALDMRYAAREWAHMHWIWEQAGFTQHDLCLRLGGSNLGHELFLYRPKDHAWSLNIYADSEMVAAELLRNKHLRKVRYLHGYPTSIYAFLREMQRVHPQVLALLRERVQAVFLGSEYPAPVYRDYIEHVLGARTLSWYGHSEMAALAYETTPFLYAPFQSYGFIEAVHSEAGCRLVSTAFDNDVHPFIRYDTGDLIEPLDVDGELVRVFRIKEGREGEVIEDRNGKKISLTGLIFGRHHRLFELADYVQISQKEPGHATIHVSTSAEIPPGGWSVYFDGSHVDIQFEFRVRAHPYRTAVGKAPVLIPDNESAQVGAG